MLRTTNLAVDDKVIKSIIAARNARMRASIERVFNAIHKSVDEEEISRGASTSNEFYGVGDEARQTGELSDLFETIHHQANAVPYLEGEPYVGPDVPPHDYDKYLETAVNTARFNSHFPVLDYPVHVVYTDVDSTSGSTTKRPFYIFSRGSQSDHHNIPVVFYIPGTALQFENSPTSDITASHLKYVLDQQEEPNTNVVLVKHRLCPQVEWPTPLEDVVSALAAYIKQHEPSSITISGYSSGGMLAMLATITFLLNGIPVKNILLFAPLFDITREFRAVDSNAHPFFSYLPTIFQDNLELLAISRRLAERDTIIKESVVATIMGSMFTLNPVRNNEIYRSASILWNFRCLEEEDKKKFPPVTVIIGTHDHFLPEVDIFHAMLAQDGCSSLLVKVLGGNHGIFWKHLFTTYLIQALFTAQANQEVNLSEIDTKEIREKEEEIKKLESNSDKIKPKCLELYQMVGALFVPPPRPAAQTALSSESVAAPGLT